MSTDISDKAALGSASTRPRLLLVEGQTARRLTWIASLRHRFDVLGVEEGEDPARVARAQRPEIILVSAEGAEVEDAIRLAHRLKTGPMPPCLGLICPGRGRPSPEQALRRTQADGYLGGDVTPQRVLDWALRLRRGEHVIEDLPLPPRNPLRRLWGP